MGNCLCAIFQSGSTSNNNSYQSRLQVSNDDDSYPDGHILAISNLIKFSFKELKIATRNFKPDTVLGKGCFGEVFKGWLDEKQQPRRRRDMTSRTAVAIKRLDLEDVQYSEVWQTEIEFLGRLSHPNLVKFLGYCSKNSHCLLLVYEYVQRGSLENHLFGRGSIVQPLPWELRIKIAIGAARAFVFLVEVDDRVILGHIKPSNILLDKAYNVKISDFGLAKLSPSRTIDDWVVLRCSRQYIAPEYPDTGHLDLKSDVYSFGVVLVELLTGLRASEQKTSVSNWMKPYLLDKRMLISIMDSKVGNYPLKAAMETAKLAFNCIALIPETRPSMNEVLDTLERIQAID